MGSIKALVLFSGGFDSLLVYFILKKEKINPMALIFTTPFFSAKKAEKIAIENTLNYRIIDIGNEYIYNVLLNPPNGYGKNLNPCIDCHSYMIKKAKEIMQREGFSFIATGDVVGQRPMSQKKAIFNKIDKENELQGYILRPLSGNLLPETIPERKRWIKKEALHTIQGRSRREQIKIAKVIDLTVYGSPGGGCLLTDRGYCQKAQIVIGTFDKPDKSYFDVIKYGRVFQLEKAVLIVGRNQGENEKIMKSGINGTYFETIDIPGPDGLLIGKKSKENIRKSKEIIARYSGDGVARRIRK